MLERVNLVPQKSLSDKLKNKTPLITGGLLLLVIIFIFIQNYSINHSINSNEKELIAFKQNVKSFDQIQAQIIDKKTLLDQLTKQSSEVAERVAKLENVRQQKRRFSALLSDITSAQPSSVISKKIILSKGTGEIVGVAKGYEELPEFIERLKRSGMFKHITLKAINRESTEGETLFEFNIVGELQ